MRRGGAVNGTDALDTINAAATAIASAENRVPQASVQKKKWGSFWSLYWCFGSNKTKKIGHAVLVPETTPATSSPTPPPQHPHPPPIILPFTAPPSSPASFLPSEPPSATQSPTGLLTSISANMYSPSGPTSIFAIGPYAHEPQLVSPPVFSTFTTEPSTAPYTPPPESVHHLTTPSSPEVPFARLLEPYLQQNGQKYPSSQYEFQSYHLQPGSPVSHLISPCSGISVSGTSSPFFLDFPPRLLDLDKIALREWESSSCQVSGDVTPEASVGPRSSRGGGVLDRQVSDVAPLPDNNTRRNEEDVVVDHRVSFEITAEEVIRCVEKKPRGEEKAIEMASGAHEEDRREKRNRTSTLGSTKEFNFENVEGGNCDEPSRIESRDWSFFPMVQTGVS